MPGWTEVPADDAGEAALFEFANTYNGYGVHGPQLGPLTERVKAAWERDGTLPDDLDDLRGCLFLTARAHRHAGRWGAFDRDEFVRALVRRIRVVSGGSVPGGRFDG